MGKQAETNELTAMNASSLALAVASNSALAATISSSCFQSFSSILITAAFEELRVASSSLRCCENTFSSFSPASAIVFVMKSRAVNLTSLT